MALLPSVAAGAMHGAVVPIAYAKGTSSGVEINFSSIPQIYQDLRIVVNALPSNSNTVAAFYFNNTTGNTCSTTWLQGNGSSSTSARITSQITITPSGNVGYLSSSNPSTLTIDILNYANNTTYKTLIGRTASDQNGSGITVLGTGLCQTTNPITAITMSTLNGGYFWTANTSVELFGIRTVGQ